MAISEFAETMDKNWDRIEQDVGPLAENDCVKSFSHFVQKLNDLCEPFRKHVGGNEGLSCSESEAKAKLLSLKQAISEMEEIDEFYLHKMTHVGASMYLLGIHLHVMKYIFSNMEDVGSNCGGDLLDAFKKEKNFQSYSEAIIGTRTQNLTQGTTKRVRRSFEEIISLKRKDLADGCGPSSSGTCEEQGKKEKRIDEIKEAKKNKTLRKKQKRRTENK